ncbi:hypothetical protein BJX99DRAFT_45532 [Aspergillus californicus]
MFWITSNMRDIAYTQIYISCVYSYFSTSTRRNLLSPPLPLLLPTKTITPTPYPKYKATGVGFRIHSKNTWRFNVSPAQEVLVGLNL